MSLNTRTILKFILITWTTIFIACSSVVSQNSIYMSPLNTQNDNSMKSCAILPFTNKTAETGIEILVRKSFYNYFSSKNFRDIELNVIDRILEIHDQKSSKPWRELSAQDVGKLFCVDCLIYGRVMEFKKFFWNV